MRHGCRRAFYVRRQRCVELDVMGSMFADDVDYTGTRFFGIVQIGQTVGQAGRKMQQSGGRLSRHPVVTIRRTGDNALEQT